MPENDETVQMLDDTLIMVTVPRATGWREIKRAASDWFIQQGGPVPTAYRTLGYRNWETPIHQERIIFEVKW